jgi:hypothetical protein
VAAGMAVMTASWSAAQDADLRVENDVFAVSVSKAHGTITSLVVKELGCDLIGEKRLAANFRINLPLPDYLCHYINGAAQQPASVEVRDAAIEVRFSGLTSEKGSFPLELAYTVALVDDTVRFKSRLTNHTEYPVAEFWFPQIGGWTDFGDERNALLAVPNYIGCGHHASLFRGFPGGRGLGAEAAEFSTSYPGMVMPWWDLYDAETNRGLYLGYHDETFRLSTWHCNLFPNASGAPGDAWMTPEQAAGAPVGMVFSHVRYPYIGQGETLDSGEFIVRMHRGDWHHGSKFYRQWFMDHFPFDKSDSWLRKQSAWFTSIIYQPEDRVIADYPTYDRWCADAQACGINCFELIGWDKGGLERDYPEYVPEEKLGGREGFRNLLKSIKSRDGKCLVFVNYNVLDCSTDWYKRELKIFTHQDTFGNTPNWMGWGESTLTARLALSTRRHVLASAVPGFQKVLEDKLLALVEDGADGFQIDKVVAGSALDFNPLNTEKPDVALCEGLVRGIASIYEKARKINPEFRLASEASQDRLLPYVDVYYRNSGGFDIAPLRYVFPEWTSCQHVAAPYDFNGVNASALTGSVICIEPDSYQNTLADPQYQTIGAYIKEVERIRKELADIVFLGNYYDTLDGTVQEITIAGTTDAPAYTPVSTGALPYRVHGHPTTDRRALVVANTSMQDRSYFWEFLNADVREAELYEPFQAVRTVTAGAPVTLKGQGLHFLVEKGRETAEGVALRMRCGLPPNEIAFARDGFDVRVLEGFSCAWVSAWVPPTYHCRAHEKEIQIELTVPPDASGTLALYVFDADGMGGGRKEEILVDDASLGIIEGFGEGRWITHDMTPDATADGRVQVRIINHNPQSNAVLSRLEWREKDH